LSIYLDIGSTGNNAMTIDRQMGEKTKDGKIATSLKDNDGKTCRIVGEAE
jgi:hypothetical protein